MNAKQSKANAFEALAGRSIISGQMLLLISLDQFGRHKAGITLYIHPPQPSLASTHSRVPPPVGVGGDLAVRVYVSSTRPRGTASRPSSVPLFLRVTVRCVRLTRRSVRPKWASSTTSKMGGGTAGPVCAYVIYVYVGGAGIDRYVQNGTMCKAERRTGVAKALPRHPHDGVDGPVVVGAVRRGEAGALDDLSSFRFARES